MMGESERERGSTEPEVEMDVEAVCDLRGFLRYERGRERGE